VPLVVRTWNLFHGNTSPPGRRAYLRQMVELVTADGPGVVCLQEIPLWALAHLEAWSSMRSVSAVARRPRLGSAGLGRWITTLNHGLFRSAFTGEADAILVDRRFGVSDERRTVVATAPLRRVVHSVLLDRGLAVVNFHISGVEAEWKMVQAFASSYERVVAAGDANIRGAGIEGFSPPLADSIDQILVNGIDSTPPHRWPDERRRLEGRLLSDHAPVELTLE
jgi:endonuclease/exonuclease/phosphatase family metal-dependent hydrolase